MLSFHVYQFTMHNHIYILKWLVYAYYYSYIRIHSNGTEGGLLRSKFAEVKIEIFLRSHTRLTDDLLHTNIHTYVATITCLYKFKCICDVRIHTYITPEFAHRCTCLHIAYACVHGSHLFELPILFWVAS